MINTPVLLTTSKKRCPQLCFSLHTPWVYNDITNGGNPRHDEGCVNGSGVDGGCYGSIYLQLTDKNAGLISSLEREEIYTGTWNTFYKEPYSFVPQEMALADHSYADSPVNQISFDMYFNTGGSTGVGKEAFNDEDKQGSYSICIETVDGAFHQLAENESVMCFLSFGSGLCFSSSTSGVGPIIVTLPDTPKIRFRDIRKIHIGVIAGLISLRF